MKVKATVVVYLGGPKRKGKAPVYVDINGKDLSILIGRQQKRSTRCNISPA
jgi:hypothetical protein